MPKRDVGLTKKVDRCVKDSVESGRYDDENQVVGAALERLEREERGSASQRAALDAALKEWEESGPAEGDVVARKAAKWASAEKARLKEITYSQRAEKDFEEIAEYNVERWSEAQADATCKRWMQHARDFQSIRILAAL